MSDPIREASVMRAARKVAKYSRLYGLSRTWVKVEGQIHLRKTGTRPARGASSNDQPVGIIGCGNFAYTTIAYYLRKNFGSVIRGTSDINPARASSLAQRYSAGYWTSDPQELLNDPKVRLVFIASNHKSHADYAIAALAAGKSVHIEKPHAVSMEQLRRLTAAMRESTGRVNLGYNRPNSSLGAAIRKAVAAETGPSMTSWFIAGHDLPPDHWYYSAEEGGRVLGNMTHWIDFILAMDRESTFPVVVRPGAYRDQNNSVVTYEFSDGSVATVSFSAKAEVLEGVSERLVTHRGSLLATLVDFEEVTLSRDGKNTRIRSRHRDHGHAANVLRSYRLLSGDSGWNVDRVWDSGLLSLATRAALDDGSPLVLSANGDFGAPD